MTPRQKKIRNTLEREYLVDLLVRKLRAPCPECGAKPHQPCIFKNGPRLGKPMAGCHGARSREANRLGYVKGPHFWRVTPG